VCLCGVIFFEVKWLKLSNANPIDLTSFC